MSKRIINGTSALIFRPTILASERTIFHWRQVISSIYMKDTDKYFHQVLKNCGIQSNKNLQLVSGSGLKCEKNGDKKLILSTGETFLIPRLDELVLEIPNFDINWSGEEFEDIINAIHFSHCQLNEDFDKETESMLTSTFNREVFV